MVGYIYEKRPELYLVSLQLEFLPKEDRSLICYAIATARLTYAQKWRVTEILTIGEWLVKLYNFIDLDHLTRTLENRNPLHYRESMTKLKEYLKKEQQISGLMLKINKLRIVIKG